MLAGTLPILSCLWCRIGQSKQHPARDMPNTGSPPSLSGLVRLSSPMFVRDSVCLEPNEQTASLGGGSFVWVWVEDHRFSSHILVQLQLMLPRVEQSMSRCAQCMCAFKWNETPISLVFPRQRPHQALGHFSWMRSATTQWYWALHKSLEVEQQSRHRSLSAVAAPCVDNQLGSHLSHHDCRHTWLHARYCILILQT